MKEWSRRDLLPFTRQSPLPAPEAGVKKVERGPAAPEMTRQDFIKFILGAAAAIKMGEARPVGAEEGIGANRGRSSNEQEAFVTSPLNVAQSDRSLTGSPDDTPRRKLDTSDKYLDTALEQGLVMIAKTISTTVMNRLEIENGNKSLTDEDLVKYLKDKPLEGLLKITVLGPVFEEMIYRFFPDAFIGANNKSLSWDVGIPTSLIFALAHNHYVDEVGDLKFAKSIPLTEFMGGLFYWYLMRKKGFDHAVLAHTINNAVAFSIGVVLFNMYPEDEALRKMRALP